jgi:hypothetical protein
MRILQVFRESSAIEISSKMSAGYLGEDSIGTYWDKPTENKRA